MLKDQKLLFTRLFLLAAIFSLCGCLASHTSQITHSGTQVTQATLDEIKPGVTTLAWVQATLGPATSKTVTGNDEIWKYVYTEHTDSTGAIFLIFIGTDSSEKTDTTFIEFKDGIVKNKWRG